MGRCRQFKFNLSDEEFRMLDELAGRQGLNRSAYARQLISREAENLIRLKFWSRLGQIETGDDHGKQTRPPTSS